MTVVTSIVVGYLVAALMCGAWWARGIRAAMRDMDAGVKHPETSWDDWEKAKKIRVEHPTLYVVAHVGVVIVHAAFWPIWLVGEIRSSRTKA